MILLREKCIDCCCQFLADNISLNEFIEIIDSIVDSEENFASNTKDNEVFEEHFDKLNRAVSQTVTEGEKHKWYANYLDESDLKNAVKAFLEHVVDIK